MGRTWAFDRIPALCYGLGAREERAPPLALIRGVRPRVLNPMMPMKSPTSILLRTALCWAGILCADTVRGDAVVQRWAIAPDDRPYVGTGNLERGAAYNPVTRNVLLLGRFGAPRVYVLNGADGTDGSADTGEPRTLSPLNEAGESVIAGGTFTLNLVGAADDGAVYACNLATSLGTVRIYRWANDSVDTPISIAYSGDPLADVASPGSGQDIRFGDNFAVRGAGKETQLVQTSRNGKYIVVYSTTDGVEFTSKVYTTPADISGKIGFAVAFGEGNTLWAKANGNGLQRIAFEAATGRATLLNAVPTTIVAGGVTGIGVDPVAKVLAAVDFVAHRLSVYDISDPAGLVAMGEPLAFPTANANGNGTAAAAVRGTNIVALDTNNGLLAAYIEKSVVADPPSISSQPGGGSPYAGGGFTLAVAAQGTPPFTYQWYFNDAVIPGATGAQLVLTNLTPSQAGEYVVEVANAAGKVRSNPANLVVRTPLAAGILKPAWALNPGDRPYFGTDNAQRGLAWNPATSNLLVASRSPANAIVVLDSATGAEKHRLRTTAEDETPVFIGGTLVLNMVGVADDGVVYAANLVTDGTASSFRLYRWENDGPDAIPAALMDVPELAVAERWGDTFDVRGRGATTEILIGSRGLAPQEGGKFAILGSGDGFNFSGRVYAVSGLPSASVFGLGIAFGPGNSVFGTANGQPLVHSSFNPASGTAELARAYTAAQVPQTVSIVAYQPTEKLLAGIALDTPDNVVLYDVADLDNPVLLDQQLIVPEQPNINGTGAADFGGNRLFVLNTNHGLRAYDIVRGGATGPATLSEARVASGRFTARLTGTQGRSYTLQRSADLRAWTDLGNYQAPAEVSDAAASGAAFYRAVAR